MSGADTFKLEELAEKAGTSPRTIRYYVQRGLLPGPAFRGKDSTYSREHLVRLRAIRRLQERFLPLDAIQAELAQRSLDELEQIAAGVAAPTSVAPSVAPRASAQAFTSSPSSPPSRWARIELAPGLELHVADGASDQIRALAEQLREHARRGTL